jgi:hypothetical protein
MPNKIMEIEILEQKIKDYSESNDKRICNVENDIKEIKTELGTKVSWIIFWSIMGILITIVGGMWWLLYTEIKDVRQTTTITSTSVSKIQGILEQAEITK